MQAHRGRQYLPDGQLTLPSQKKNLAAGRLRQHRLIQDHLRRTAQQRLETQMTNRAARFRQLVPGAGDRCQGRWLESRGQVTLPTRRLRHLAAAGMIAAAAIVSGSAIGDPATACAAPKPWDPDEHGACVQSAYDDWQAGRISKQTYQELVAHCCFAQGGKWVPDSLSDAGGTCLPPPRPGVPGAAGPGQIPTQTLEPAPPPVRQPGSVNPTATFAPAG